jgi:serine protease AprX
MRATPEGPSWRIGLEIAAQAARAFAIAFVLGVATPPALSPNRADAADIPSSWAAAARATPSSNWVFFRDHGPGEAGDSALAAAARNLSPRALARRARAAAERARRSTSCASLVDSRDLDPEPGYVKAVEMSGAHVRTVSRWLNAVSVEADSGALARIRAMPFVAGAESVGRVTLDSRNAGADFGYGPSEHQLEMLGVPEAHAMGFRGEGVLIGVLDSGFDLNHEAFDQLSVLAQRDFVYNDDDTSFDPRQDFPGQSSHGTTVLSAIAGYAPGKILGPAYRADYLLAKTERIGSETRDEEDAWCAAIEWVEALGADLATSSLSYSAWYRPQDLDGRTAVITRAADIAAEHGLLIVNSMGNFGPRKRSLSPPADSPAVIAVGSVDANGRLSGFSSLGPTWDGRMKPDLVAMGSGVTLARDLTRDLYGRGNGTSFSAPLVAGCAALVMSAHPDWGPEAVRDALVMSGDRASHPDPRYGWGVPNARDAILYPFVEGAITDAHTHEPLARARIAWEPAPGAGVDSVSAAPGDSSPRGETRSDSTGAYLISNLPAGTYRLRIEAPGYFEWVSEPLQVPPSLGDVNAALRYRGE